MEFQFGQDVHKESLQLAGQGKDPNQIANVLCQKDKEGHNYGIGIILNGHGDPMPSSSTLIRYAQEELKSSQSGKYLNSAKAMEDLKKAVLSWQRIPEKYWGQFELALPSDAGTGAVQTGVETACVLNPAIQNLGIEKLGWPAYKAIAKVAKLACKEFGPDEVISGKDILPIYQSGPMNTTGQVRGADVMVARAKAAGKDKSPVLLDRAYSGFEFARLLSSKSYDEVMRMSYDLQIRPFIEEGAPFFMALSPTKAFVTFALRPCGFLLVFCPDVAKKKEVSLALGGVIRARGSSFEHPITRAFVKAMVKEPESFEKEHQMALQRLSEAETKWRKLVAGTKMEYLFTDQYAGLFRNPQANEGAAVSIYNEHMYPVFSKDRCRLNATGIPSDEALAKKHVTEFAKHCF